ncbi:hypothetical protein BGW38_007045 [Lunasporangiospora selenospora]|uniref:Uncharacterized protein n=1 Tax=Lunasporangiospora selenospora TaxID=979761 RepID=A0A9P6G0R5_9FUNG|nr:hypothetical protein BGW38_007045 [Lunasporangiospora selenospora]
MSHNDDAIAALQHQLAAMAKKLAKLTQDSTHNKDPQIKDPIQVRTFNPSEEERDRYPPIWPSDPDSFYRNEITDDNFWEQFRPYPKNSKMQYEPPKTTSTVKLNSFQKSHESNLRSIQKRLVNLTRPIDLFLHQIWSMEERDSINAEDMVEICSNLATLMRDHLAGTAGKVQSMRLEVIRQSKGTTYKRHHQSGARQG